jgi:preprotein translocase subunit SecG
MTRDALLLLLMMLLVLLLLLLLLQRGMGEEATIKFMAVAHTDSVIVTAVRGEHSRGTHSQMHA